MKLIYLLLTLLFLFGCGESDHSKNILQEPSTSAFNIYLSPSLSGALQDLVAVNSQLVVNATQELNSSTINEQNLYIQSLSGERPDIKIHIIDDDIVLVPTIYLSPETRYELIMTTAVKTVTGASRSKNAVISFKTAQSIDDTPPTLIGTLPLSGSEAEPYSSIYFQFSEPISPLSIQEISFKLQADGSTKEIPGKLTILDDLLSFVPDENLSKEIIYRGELNTSTITDYSGNHYVKVNTAKVSERINSTSLSSGIETLYFYINNYMTPNNPLLSSKVITLKAKVNCMASDFYDVIIGTNRGLDFLEYNNSATPKLSLISHFERPELGAVYSIKIDRNAHNKKRIYVGSSNGFFILDYNLSHPSILGHYATQNSDDRNISVYGIDINNDFSKAYVAATTLGVLELNISNETNLTLMNTLNDINSSFDVIESGSDDLFISNYNNDLINITGFDLDTITYAGYIGHVRNSIFSNEQLFSSLGIQGIGINNNERTFAAASYVTRIVERAENSAAIIKDIGFGFFNPYSYDDPGYIYHYIKTPFEVSAIGFVDQNIDKGDGYFIDILLISDKDGNIYIYEQDVSDPYGT